MLSSLGPMDLLLFNYSLSIHIKNNSIFFQQVSPKFDLQIEVGSFFLVAWFNFL